LKGKNTFG